MSRWPLTESANRAMQHANCLADRENSDFVEPLHLLRALIREESRAAELLRPFGITTQLFDGEPAVGDVRAETSVDIARSRTLRRVVAEAGQYCETVIGQREIGSEHLLWGLAVVESPASALLNQQGFDPAVINGDQAMQNEPLPIDFEIQWQSDNASVAGDETDRERRFPAHSGPDHATLRILDAAANRAREGLRVIEDFTRFQLDDGHLTRLLKECRHELTVIFASFPVRDLLTARDTVGDVGTAITTPSEFVRHSPRDVAAANFKRVQEAVRSLEEFGKCVSPAIGRRCESIRYRLYTLEKAVLTTAAGREQLAGCRLYLLLTRSLCRCDPETVLQGALSSGVDVIQIREKDMPDAELLAWALHVRKVIDTATETTTKPLLIMNDRPDLAMLGAADGVHVGQEELPVAAVRRIIGPDRLIGVSTHDISQARQAVLDGADYLGVGPVFPSNTKSFAKFAGLDFVQQVADEISLPWFAIGGITAANMSDVVAAGATRIAVSGAITAADHPAESASELRTVTDT